MFLKSFLALLSVPLVFADAQFQFPFAFPVPKGDGTDGSGRYPSKFSIEPSLKGHTIYSPVLTNEKFPVLLWGNGMCYDQGLGFRNFLTEVASHGYFVIANGDPEGKGQSSDTKLHDALEWVVTNAGTGKYMHVDKTKIIAAGQSCGGIQAYKVSPDKRISLTAIFDSGNLFGDFDLSSLHAPVGYFLGGKSDIAYKDVSLMCNKIIIY
jgi:hypothetical protein